MSAPSRSRQKFQVHFAFTAHDQVGGVMNFMDRIKWADVVCTEMSGWGESDREILQAVANGNYPVRSALYRLFENGFAHEENIPIVRRFLEEIFNSQKLIFFADVPATDRKLCEKLIASDQHLQAIDNLCVHTFEGNFEDALKECRVLLAKFLAEHEERERVIIRRLIKDLPIVTQQRLTTTSEDAIKVAVSLGMGHSPMLRSFQGSNVETSCSFPYSIQFFDSTTTALRTMRVPGKKNALSDEMVARVLLDHHVIEPANMWPEVPRQVTRIIGHTFSLAEIQALFAEAKLNPTPAAIKTVTRKHLDAKGIPLSQDPDDWLAYVDTLSRTGKWPDHVSKTLRFPFEQELQAESWVKRIFRKVKWPFRKDGQ